MRIVFLTDFGYFDWYAASMKAVVLSLAEENNVKVSLDDITHNIPPQDIMSGAFALYASYRYFPKNTVFCCVIDPGVGTERYAIAVKANGYFFVLPNNGLLTYILRESDDYSIFKIENKEYFLKNVSNTFHGRDIFAPSSFYIAFKNDISFLGEELKKEDLIWADFPDLNKSAENIRKAFIIYIDRFGNLITNIRNEYADKIKLVYNESYLPLVDCYEKAEADIFVLPGSSGFLEVSVKNGSAAEKTGKKISDYFDVGR